MGAAAVESLCRPGWQVYLLAQTGIVFRIFRQISQHAARNLNDRAELAI